MTAREKPADDEEEKYTIGQLADEFGLTLRGIRFYEDEKLLTPVRAGQVRLYSRRDHARLSLICRGKRLGFSIAEIREFLDLYDMDPGQVEQMRYLLEHARQRMAALKVQLADVKQTLAELQTIEAGILAHLEHKQHEG